MCDDGQVPRFLARAVSHMGVGGGVGGGKEAPGDWLPGCTPSLSAARGHGIAEKPTSCFFIEDLLRCQVFQKHHHLDAFNMNPLLQAVKGDGLEGRLPL